MLRTVLLVLALAVSVTASAQRGGKSYNLNVSVDGAGTVTSVPTGIDCATSCSTKFASGTDITLTATADTGAEFQSWSGACTEADPVCALTITSNTSVTATFSALPPGPGMPVISQVFVDETTETIVIRGENYVDGTTIATLGSPNTFLGIFNVATDGGELSAFLPTDLPHGDYLLRVANDTNVAEWQLTYPATGPQGPPGADGAEGPAGADGAPGPAGADGAPGPAGADGAPGADGADGAPGAEGLSAYEVWVNLGNTGSEADFFASLRGPQGDKGDQGDPGQDGTDGVNGTNGTNGTDGAAGLSAYQVWLSLGNTGSEGDFIASLVGSAGADGADGRSCSVVEEESVAILTCDDGTSAVLAGAGTVVIWPEGGVNSPAPFATGDIAWVDANDVLLGEGPTSSVTCPPSVVGEVPYCTYDWKYLELYVGEPVNSDVTFLIRNGDVTQEIEFSAHGVELYYQSEDCTGTPFVAERPDHAQGHYAFGVPNWFYVPVPGAEQRLVVGSARGLVNRSPSGGNGYLRTYTACGFPTSPIIDRAWPTVEFNLPSEWTNAVYPARLLQLP